MRISVYIQGIKTNKRPRHVCHFLRPGSNGRLPTRMMCACRCCRGRCPRGAYYGRR